MPENIETLYVVVDNYFIPTYCILPKKCVVKEISISKWWIRSGKIAFIFSISIEILQLLLRLGTFQLSDIFYNTVGGMIGGLIYCAVMKARKRL